MRTIGFIGMGNMAQALAGGFISKGVIEGRLVYAYAPNQEKLRKNADIFGFNASAGLKELIGACDVLVMACKPYQIEGVLKTALPLLKGKALLSIAAGWDFDAYQPFLKEDVRFQFIMPNTPAMAGDGVFLFEEKNSLLPEEEAWAKELFGALGLVEVLPSRLMEIGSAISGCGPAFVDLLIEGYADSAVKYGIPRETAYRLVSHMVRGSAALQIATGEHPGSLKDKVCSPGGTTILGVAALEEEGFRRAVLKSIDAVMHKNR